MPKDATYHVSRNLPNGGSSNASQPIDVGALNFAGANMPGAQVEIEWPSMPLNSGQTVTFTVEESADGSTFTSTGLGHVITGTAQNTCAAGVRRLTLGAHPKRYLRVSASGSVGAGTLSSGYYGLWLVFAES